MTARDRWIVWGLGVLAVTLSGVALTMLVVVGAALLWSRGLRVALEAVSVPVLVYLVWTSGWGREGGSLLSTEGIDRVPDVVATGLGFAFDDLTRLPYAGIVVLVALSAYVLVTWRRWTGTRAWALCSAAGAVVFYAIVAIRRDSPFLPGPKTGRYLWMAFALLVPLIALAVTALVRRWRAAVLASAVLATVLIGIQVDALAHDARTARERKATERGRIVAAARLAAAGMPMVEDSVLANSVFEDSATVDLLTRLARDGDLPDAEVGVQDRLGARADLQVALDTWPDDADHPPAQVVGLHQATATRTADGCIVVTPAGTGPHVRFAPSDVTTAARLEGDFPTGIGFAVVRTGTTGPWRPVIPFVAGPFRLRFAAADTDVLMGTGATTVTLCNVTVDPAVLVE